MEGSCASGGVAFVLRKHMAGQGEQLFGFDWPGVETHAWPGVVCWSLPSAAEHQHLERGHTRMKLCHKCRTADPRHVVARDHQAKIHGKVGLLDQAERLGCIANPLHVCESLLQDRLAQKRLERIVVH